MSFARLREKELWILIAGGLLLFYRPLIFGEVFYFRDLHLHFFPQKLLFAALVRAGEFPVWDPYLHGGQPFLADLNNMALYPTNIIYLLLPPVLAFNLDIIAHVLLSAVAAYWLARSLNLPRSASLVAGAVYGFCGYTLSLANLLSRLSAMPYLPLILLALQSYIKQKRWRWFVVSAVLGSFQLFSGAPEMTLLTFLTVLGWLLTFESRLSLPGKFKIFFALALFVAGMSAVQILPTADMVQQSIRSENSDYNTFSAWSLHPRRLPELIFPGFFGETNRATTKPYWGGSYESMGFPFILSLYFGWLVLSLALFGTFLGKDCTKLRIFLALLALLTLLFSIGRNLPGFQAVYQYLPFAGSVRYPIKIFAAGILPISLLAAFGLSSIEENQNRRRFFRWYFGLSAILMLLLFCLFRFAPHSAARLADDYFNQTSPSIVEGLSAAFLQAAIVGVLTALFYFYSQLRTKPALQLGLALLVLCDLMVAGYSVNAYAPAELYTATPTLVQTVKQNLHGGRFFRAPNPAQLTVRIPSNDAYFFNRWQMETLHNYSGSFYKIPVIYHEDFDNLAQKQLVELSNYVFLATPERRLPLLTAAGVSAFIAADDPQKLPFEPVNVLRNISTRNFFLYANRYYNGVAFFVPEAFFVNTEREAFHQVTKADFDPRNTVYLHSEDQEARRSLRKCEQTELRMVERKPTRWTYQAVSACDSYLYISQPYYEGWITLVNGKEVPTLRANYAFSASMIPAGEHRIERVYQPQSVKFGMIISLVATILLAVPAIFNHKK